MTNELLITLTALALVDSLSFGTLLIPLYFLLAPERPRIGRMLAYLAVIASFYFAIGVILLLGATTIFERFTGLSDSAGARWTQFLVGAVLLVWSFFIGGSKGSSDGGRPGRLSRWRDKAMSADAGLAPLMLLALGAGLAEFATMLPYLGAIGLLGAAELTPSGRLVVLAGYCLVMILPALLLLVGRLLAGRLVEPRLRRMAEWMQRNAAENTAWIVGIVGFLLARDAAVRLGLFELLS